MHAGTIPEASRRKQGPANQPRDAGISVTAIPSYLEIWRPVADPDLFPCNSIRYLRAMTESHCIVWCTVPDADTGKSLATALVEARQAACVNVLPGLTSVYRWQDAVQQDAECLLLIKTRCDRFDDLCSFLRARHPYELPEIVAVPLVNGLPAYLAWIDQCIDPNLESTT